MLLFIHFLIKLTFKNMYFSRGFVCPRHTAVCLWGSSTLRVSDNQRQHIDLAKDLRDFWVTPKNLTKAKSKLFSLMKEHQYEFSALDSIQARSSYKELCLLGFNWKLYLDERKLEWTCLVIKISYNWIEC